MAPGRAGRDALREGMICTDYTVSLSYCLSTGILQRVKNLFAKRCYLRTPPCVCIGMGLVITPIETPRRFNPLSQPLATSQKFGGRELVWRFDGGDITSDGGALLLQKLEARTGIVRRFAACFTDYRNPRQIEHPLLDLITQRVFGLALGYEDLNDHDELRRDPMLAVALSKDDVKGEQRRRAQDRGKALAGKSTLNRLELTADAPELTESLSYQKRSASFRDAPATGVEQIMEQTADIALIGLAVMGQNLIMNMNDHGYTVIAYNRTVSKVDEFLKDAAKGRTTILGAHSIEEMVKLLKRPRKIMLMVKAGKPVDEFIETLLPLLEPGDLIIDGGNSHFPDTIRRTNYLESKGMLFIGTGVSGGEEGARFGPSMMPGGSVAAWPLVKDIFQAICAKTPEGEACAEWVGRDGAGHFVKMVHNGIEYGDMQLICEAYQLMKEAVGLSNEEMHDVLTEWNKGGTHGGQSRYSYQFQRPELV